MRTLIKLALLCGCAACGILIAVRLAGRIDSPAPQEQASAATATTDHLPPVAAVTSPVAASTQRTSEVPTAKERVVPATAARYASPRPRVSDRIEIAASEENEEAITDRSLLRAPPARDVDASGVPTSLVLKMLEQVVQSNQSLQAMHLMQLQTAQLQTTQLQNARLQPAAPLPAPAGPALNAPQPADPANPAETTAPTPPTPAPPAASGEAGGAPSVELLPAEVVKSVNDEGDDQLTINARNADVRSVLEQFGEQSGLNILASAGVQGTITVNLQGVGVDEALDAILKTSGYISRRDGKFVYVGTPDEFAAMDKSQDRVGTRVYRPNYIAVKELQALITPLLTPNTGKMSVTTPAAVGIAVDNTSAGGDSLSQTDALIVQDYEQILAQVDQIVRDLDRRPLQVSIETMIVSVTLNDSSSYGVDFQFLRNQPHVKFGINTPPQSLNNFALDGGLKFGFLDSSLGAFLSALETVGDANVIASPKLLCLNKQKAEILIGQRLGYISTTVTQNFASQNVEFLDVGAQLRLRPYISSDGIIRIEVHPELSEGEVVVNGGFTLPRKTLTEVTTNVMCPDGRTVVLGGLMRQNLRTNTSQVPYLGSLPAVGPLFRRKNDSNEKTEILVLLTPRIVYDGDLEVEGQRYQDDTLDMENAKFHRMTPLSRAHLSRDNLDRAEMALRDGNRSAALRYARRAVDFDPLNRDAVRLLYSLGSQGGATPQLQGLGVETIIGDEEAGPPTVDGEIPPWMLDELRSDGAVGPPAALHPRDPGTPGAVIDVVRPEAIGNAQP